VAAHGVCAATGFTVVRFPPLPLVIHSARSDSPRGPRRL